MKKFKLILLLVLLIEIALFILVGHLIGVFFTLLLVVATMIVGFSLFKKQSLQTMQKMQEAMQSGKPPMFEFIHQTLISIAAILLIIPGFLTDIIALLLLIPKLRPMIVKFLTKAHMVAPKNSRQKKDDIIEGEYWKDDDDDSKHLK